MNESGGGRETEGKEREGEEKKATWNIVLVANVADILQSLHRDIGIYTHHGSTLQFLLKPVNLCTSCVPYMCVHTITNIDHVVFSRKSQQKNMRPHVTGHVFLYTIHTI